MAKAKKTVRKMELGELMGVMNGEQKVLYLGATDRAEYTDDGKKTGKFDATVVGIASRELGWLDLVCPYVEGLVEKLDDTYEYGERIAVTQIGTAVDASVGIYNDALNIKIIVGEVTA